jgi:hypothetical protein
MATPVCSCFFFFFSFCAAETFGLPTFASLIILSVNQLLHNRKQEWNDRGNESRTFVWYETDRVENYAFSSCVVACVVVAAVTSLPSRCLATIRDPHTNRKFTIYSTNGAIIKYVIRKHLCGAIIQWGFSYTVYCALCCSCLYSSSSLWSFRSEGHCHFGLRLTFSGLLNSIT